MKKIILALAVLALSSTSSFAARGDAGEGNGGGGGSPKPYLATVPVYAKETYQEQCNPTQTWVPASMACGSSNSTTLNRFDDFTNGCKYTAGRWDITFQTCNRERDVQVGTTTQWTCPPPYVYQEFKDKHEVTRVCRRPGSDRGNVGNR